MDDVIEGSVVENYQIQLSASTLEAMKNLGLIQ